MPDVMGKHLFFSPVNLFCLFWFESSKEKQGWLSCLALSLQCTSAELDPGDITFFFRLLPFLCGFK